MPNHPCSVFDDRVNAKDPIGAGETEQRHQLIIAEIKDQHDQVNPQRQAQKETVKGLVTEKTSLGTVQT